MNEDYDWYSILAVPPMYALISALILTMRFSYFGSLLTYEYAHGTILLFTLIMLLAIILVVFPFKIGYKISEGVEDKKLLQGSLGAVSYFISTFISSFIIIILTLKFTNSFYVMAEAFAFGVNLISILIFALIFLLTSTCSAFMGAFKQTKSKN